MWSGPGRAFAVVTRIAGARSLFGFLARVSPSAFCSPSIGSRSPSPPLPRLPRPERRRRTFERLRAAHRAHRLQRRRAGTPKLTRACRTRSCQPRGDCAFVDELETPERRLDPGTAPVLGMSALRVHATVLTSPPAQRSSQADHDDRARLRRHQSTAVERFRTRGRAVVAGMATEYGHPPPPEALAAHHHAGRGPQAASAQITAAPRICHDTQRSRGNAGRRSHLRNSLHATERCARMRPIDRRAAPFASARVAAEGGVAESLQYAPRPGVAGARNARLGVLGTPYAACGDTRILR